MAAGVSAVYRFWLDLTETVASGLDLVADSNISHAIAHAQETLDAASTPAVTKCYSDTLTMTGAELVVDMEALGGPSGTTVNFNGLKLQLIKIENNGSNDITVEPAAVEGYPIWGAADGKLVIHPGGTEMRFLNDGGAEITADTDDKIGFTGTAADTCNVILIAG